MLRNGLEPWHLLVVLAVVVLLFGSKKLPEMARGLGRSMRILKAETAAMRTEDQPADHPADQAVPAAPAAGAPTPTPGPAPSPVPTPDRAAPPRRPA
ncbi:Sec-independent protein translocase subunit TatA [Kitasatospora sp. NPDC089797]|uniref:Sec-independent protein translocase subunit TatA n=1 Tax=Kitasatospora sp. NPDC089797 TaxID=3155298 RepID=UPI0034387BAE